MQVQMGCRFIAQASELEDLFLNGSLLVAECDEHFSLSSHIASIECFLKHALPQASVTCIELYSSSMCWKYCGFQVKTSAQVAVTSMLSVQGR